MINWNNLSILKVLASYLNLYENKKLRTLFLKVLIFCCLPLGVIAADFNIKIVSEDNKPLSDMEVYLQPEGDVSLLLNETIVEGDNWIVSLFDELAIVMISRERFHLFIET